MERLSLDLGMFEAEGVIAERLAVEAGRLRAERAAVTAFVIDGVGCGAVWRAPLNDAIACEGEGEAGACGCFERIEVSSRAAARFVD